MSDNNKVSTSKIIFPTNPAKIKIGECGTLDNQELRHYEETGELPERFELKS